MPVSVPTRQELSSLERRTAFIEEDMIEQDQLIEEANAAAYSAQASSVRSDSDVQAALLQVAQQNEVLVNQIDINLSQEERLRDVENSLATILADISALTSRVKKLEPGALTW